MRLVGRHAWNFLIQDQALFHLHFIYYVGLTADTISVHGFLEGISFLFSASHKSHSLGFVGPISILILSND